MHKIITPKFEIDLQGYNISINEENSWFSDTFFTKYSYPFSLIITDEINKSLGDIISYDSKTAMYYLECQYVFYNKIESAFLIIESIERNLASVSLRYGMDDFPNFEKKLNELDLFSSNVSDIYTHANYIVTKKYPEVLYNYPQIHTDKYDGSTADYLGFLNILNNRKNGNFIRNTVETENDEDVMYNRNIIQPLPYLMYLIKKGFSMSGLTLTGDIVSDNLLNKILIYAEKEPFVTKDIEGLSMTFSYDDIDENTTSFPVPISGLGFDAIKYYNETIITVTTPGKYNVIGQIDLRTPNYNYASHFQVFKDNVLMFSKEVKFKPWESLVDFDFIHNSGSCEIKVVFSSQIDEFHTVYDLQILPLYFINSNGEKETNLLNENIVDLNKVVPNITFGTLVNSVLNMFNYDVDNITSSEIEINRIDNSIKQNEIIDLSAYENINVIRKPNLDSAFLVKYDNEGDVDLGGFYIDKRTTKYVTKEFNDAVENIISFPVYPLQNELINDVYTAKSIQSGDDKLCFVIYDGMQDGNNLTLDPIALSIPNLINVYHYDWLNNRVKSVKYEITFIANINKLMDLTSKKRPYCYSNYHLIRNISKTQLTDDNFEFELETETLVEL